jgi:hypothetical protein
MTSYARPGKLFTANRDLMVSEIGRLKVAPFQRIVEAVVKILQAGISSLK